MVERVRLGEDRHTCEVPLELIPARIAALHGGNATEAKKSRSKTKASKSGKPKSAG